jgi:DNA modification methylase
MMVSTVTRKLPAPVKLKNCGESLHALVTGDSIRLLPLIPSTSIHLIITDPPYNRSLNYGVFKDRLQKEAYYEMCRTWLRECARILRNDGTMYLISYPEINARLLPFIEDDLGMRFRRWITWHYPTNIGHSKRNFTRSQRSILFFTKSDEYTFNRLEIIQHYKNPEVSKVKKRIMNGSSGRTAYDFLHFLDLVELDKGMVDTLAINLLKNVSKDRLNGLHPCQLPLPLLRIFVRVSSNPGDVLLDPFAGTFTLASVACELGRDSIGIELNPDYIPLGLKRLADCRQTRLSVPSVPKVELG